MSANLTQGMTRPHLDRPFGNPGLDPELVRRIRDRPQPVRPETYPKTGAFLNPFSRHAIDTGESQRIADRLRAFGEAVPLHGLINAGSIEVIGLTDLKRQYEDRWTQIREKVHLIVDACFKLHLRDGDLAILLDDEHFLILFDARPPEECRDTAEEIAREICVRLAGESGPGKLVAVLGRNLALKLAGELPRLFSGRDTVSDIAHASRSALHRHIVEEQAAIAGIHRSFSLSFLATVNSSKRIVSAFEAIAAVPSEHVHRVSRGIGRASLDAFAVATAGAEMRRQGPRGAPFLIVPVSYATLAAPTTRPAVIEALKLLDQQLPDRGERRLLLRLGDFPAYLSYNQALTVLGFASPWILGYMLSLRAVELLKGAIQGLKVRAIVLEAGEWSAPASGTHLGRSPEAHLRLLDERLKTARGMRVLFSNVRSPDVVRILRNRFRGARPQVFVNGPGLAPAGRQIGRYCRIGR